MFLEKKLTQLLMQAADLRADSPWMGSGAFRTGCKLAVVDPTGKVLDTVVIYRQNHRKRSKRSKENPEKAY